MREFDIEFDVHQTVTYVMSVKANTPEEAIVILKNEDFDRYHAEEDGMKDSWDDVETAKCVGERITTPDGSSHRETIKTRS